MHSVSPPIHSTAHFTAILSTVYCIRFTANCIFTVKYGIFKTRLTVKYLQYTVNLTVKTCKMAIMLVDFTVYGAREKWMPVFYRIF